MDTKEFIVFLVFWERFLGSINSASTKSFSQKIWTSQLQHVCC